MRRGKICRVAEESKATGAFCAHANLSAHAHTHTHQEAEYVITSWFFFSADRSFASLSFQTNMRTSLTSSVHMCVCVCQRCVSERANVETLEWEEVGLHTCPGMRGGGGGSLPRLEGLTNTEPAAGGCTKEKFFSPLSRLELETASLKQHGKWHKQALNPARLVCSSDHEMNRRQRCVSNDTRYRPRCGSQRGGPQSQSSRPIFCSKYRKRGGTAHLLALFTLRPALDLCPRSLYPRLLQLGLV